MSKSSRNKKRGNDSNAALGPRDILSFEKINELLQSIETPFLADRTTDYVDAAETLLAEFGAQTEAGAVASPKQLAAMFKLYGKRARQLDMILAIAEASGYLPAASKAAANHIRYSIEQKLLAYVRTRDGGTIHISLATGDLKTETHSKLGRRIARLFAHYVPPTEQDNTGGLRASFLSEDAANEIANKIKTAEQLCNRGKVGEAEPICLDILATDRKNAAAIRLLGLIYTDTQKYQAAIDYCKQALIFYPEDVKLWHCLGDSYIYEVKLDEAITQFREAVRLKPDDPASLTKLASALFLNAQDEEAKTNFEKALRIAPQNAEAHAQYGTCFLFRQELEKAALHFSHALKADPQNVVALSGMGSIRADQNKVAESLDLAERALKVRPGDKGVLLRKADLLLSTGQYEEGFALSEEGLGSEFWRGGSAPVGNKPIWTGKTAPGMKLLIRSEQGLGDVLQFVRYAELCKERVGKVYFLCLPPLARLLKNCPYIDEVYTGIGTWKFDEQISVMSLPHVMKTTLENVPAKVPYLFVSPSQRKGWAPKFNAEDAKFKIGLVWSGSVFAKSLRGDLRSSRRNMNLQQFLPLFDMPQVQIYSLQMGEEAKRIDELGLRDRCRDFMGDVKDMADTAAIIENLDLVITVDTSVAHVAGGLGKPVWILSRFDCCWRWLKNKPESPWYPTARIFGQPKTGDWDTVLAAVHSALKERLSSRAA